MFVPGALSCGRFLPDRPGEETRQQGIAVPQMFPCQLFFSFCQLLFFKIPDFLWLCRSKGSDEIRCAFSAYGFLPRAGSSRGGRRRNGASRRERRKAAKGNGKAAKKRRENGGSEKKAPKEGCGTHPQRLFLYFLSYKLSEIHYCENQILNRWCVHGCR